MKNIALQNTKPIDMEMVFLYTIGMLAVVSGHYAVLENSLEFISSGNSWHMSFFMFLSGILFQRKIAHRSLLDTLYHKIKTLLLTGLFINLCYGIISYSMRYYHLVRFGGDITLKALFVYPFTHNYQFANDVALWFIFQLFLIEVIANCVYRLSSKKLDIILTIFFLAISLICAGKAAETIPPAETLLLLRTGFLFFFFTFGIIYEKRIAVYLCKIKNPIIFCILIGAIIIVLNSKTGWETHFNTRDMNLTKISFIFLPYLMFFLVSSFFIFLTKYLSPYIENNKLLLFIGNNNRYVFYHHQLCGILLGCLALIFYTKEYSFVISEFKPSLFQTSNWYAFNWFDIKRAGRIPYLLIPYFIPIFCAKFINIYKNKYIRFSLWMLLLFLVLSMIVLLGRYMQFAQLNDIES